MNGMTLGNRMRNLRAETATRNNVILNTYQCQKRTPAREMRLRDYRQASYHLILCVFYRESFDEFPHFSTEIFNIYLQTFCKLVRMVLKLLF